MVEHSTMGGVKKKERKERIGKKHGVLISKF
jgi:hypothetical protein